MNKALHWELDVIRYTELWSAGKWLPVLHQRTQAPEIRNQSWLQMVVMFW